MRSLLSLFTTLPFLLALVSANTKPTTTSTSPAHPTETEHNSSTTASGDTVKLVRDTTSVGWYTLEHAQRLLPQDISFDKYSIIIYHASISIADFAGTSPFSFSSNAANVIPPLIRLLEAAHNQSTKVMVSIGDLTGELPLSSLVHDQDKLDKLKVNLGNLVDHYGVDGLNFEWELPTSNGCRIGDQIDWESAQIFLKVMRTQLSANIKLSATVGLLPFRGFTHGQTTPDISPIIEVLDYFILKAYDLWTFSISISKTVGPNAPIDDHCEDITRREGSVNATVEAWTVPASKLLLGVASYGQSYSVALDIALDESCNIARYPSFNTLEHPSGDSWDTAPPADTKDACGNPAYISGNWYYRNMIDDPNGFLKTDGTPKDCATYRFDDCSQTPYVYNQTSQIMVSYDDPQSLKAKGVFAGKQQLAGFAMWEVAGDYDNRLVDATLDGFEEGRKAASG